MIRLSVSPRDRRILVVGSITIVALFSFARGLPFLLRWQADQRTEASNLLAAIANAESSGRLIQVLRDSVARSQAQIATISPMLLNGSTPSAGAAILASLLQDLADDSAVRV